MRLTREEAFAIRYHMGFSGTDDVRNVGAAYEMFPEHFNKQCMNIPESGDSLPDILNELKWELDWLLTMQEPTCVLGSLLRRAASMAMPIKYSSQFK